MSKKSIYSNEFVRNNYDRQEITMQKGTKEKIKKRAEALHLSVNQYINNLIAKDIEEA